MYSESLRVSCSLNFAFILLSADKGSKQPKETLESNELDKVKKELVISEFWMDCDILCACFK